MSVAVAKKSQILKETNNILQSSYTRSETRPSKHKVREEDVGTKTSNKTLKKLPQKLTEFAEPPALHTGGIPQSSKIPETELWETERNCGKSSTTRTMRRATQVRGILHKNRQFSVRFIPSEAQRFRFRSWKFGFRAGDPAGRAGNKKRRKNVLLEPSTTKKTASSARAAGWTDGSRPGEQGMKSHGLCRTAPTHNLLCSSGTQFRVAHEVGSRIMRVYLDPKQRNSCAGVYKKLTGKSSILNSINHLNKSVRHRVPINWKRWSTGETKRMPHQKRHANDESCERKFIFLEWRENRSCSPVKTSGTPTTTLTDPLFPLQSLATGGILECRQQHYLFNRLHGG